MTVDSSRFAARWSRLVWVVTISVMILVMAVGILLGQKAYPTSDMTRQTLPVLAVLVLVAIFGIAILFAPRGYVVRPDGIVIRRLVSALVIPWEQIREVRRIEPAEIGVVWRTFGSGGFFGSFGRFYSRPLGGFLAYATNQRDMILITKADGTKIVISPYPREAFLEATRRITDQTV
jgi:hypothetical protein